MLPEVGGVVAVGVHGVSPAAHLPGAVAALVKGQEVGLRALQPGGHIDVGEIHGKVYQHPVFKLEDGVLPCPVEAVLLHGVGGVLAGELAFQLHGHHRDTVEKEDDIDAVLVAQGVVELPGAVEDVGGIEGLAGFVDGGLRLPKHGAELDAPVGKALAQYLQQTHQLHLPAKTVNELPLTVGAVNLLKPLPLLGLTGADEGEEGGRVQRLFPVEGSGVALEIAAVCSEIFLNILLEAFFFVVEVRHFITSKLAT